MSGINAYHLCLLAFLLVMNNDKNHGSLTKSTQHIKQLYTTTKSVVLSRKTCMRLLYEMQINSKFQFAHPVHLIFLSVSIFKYWKNHPLLLSTHVAQSSLSILVKQDASKLIYETCPTESTHAKYKLFFFLQNGIYPYIKFL